MKFSRVSVVSALFLIFCGTGPVIAQSDEAVVSLELGGLPLSAVLDQIAAKSGTRFLVDATLSTRTGANVNLREVPLSQAIPIIAAAYGGCTKDIGQLTRIVSCSR